MQTGEIGIVLIVALILLSRSMGGPLFNVSKGAPEQKSVFALRIFPNDTPSGNSRSTDFIVVYENRSPRTLFDASLQVILPEGDIFKEKSSDAGFVMKRKGAPPEYSLGELSPGEKGELRFSQEAGDEASNSFSKETAVVAAWRVGDDYAKATVRTHVQLKNKALLADATNREWAGIASETGPTVAPLFDGWLILGGVLLLLSGYVYSLRGTKRLHIAELLSAAKPKTLRARLKDTLPISKEAQYPVKGAPPDNLPI